MCHNFLFPVPTSYWHKTINKETIYRSSVCTFMTVKIQSDSTILDKTVETLHKNCYISVHGLYISLYISPMPPLCKVVWT